MFQVFTSLLFAAVALGSMAVISAMLGQNWQAILSALSGQGAFPASLSPETDPAVRVTIAKRPAPASTSRRPLTTLMKSTTHVKTAQPTWGRAA
jgi:hypothetical protein